MTKAVVFYIRIVYVNLASVDPVMVYALLSLWSIRGDTVDEFEKCDLYHRAKSAHPAADHQGGPVSGRLRVKRITE